MCHNTQGVLNQEVREVARMHVSILLYPLDRVGDDEQLRRLICQLDRSLPLREIVRPEEIPAQGALVHHEYLIVITFIVRD